MNTCIYRLLSLCFFLPFLESTAQTIGTFTFVGPGPQTQSLVLPSTHTFQRIIKTDDALNDATTLGPNLDFTGYVPIGGSSLSGYLSISSEATPGQVAIMNVAYNFAANLWDKTNSGNVGFSTGTINSDLGTVRTFCSGTVTPRGTVIIGEENTTAGNVNSNIDAYEDLGWLIEINPATKQVMDYNGDGKQDKIWAAGRGRHENAVVKNDETIMYWGADDLTNGYMYKYVPTVAGNYSSGSLYVLKTTAALGTGTWEIVPNSTPAQ
ncbi:MAG: alkaline phosphatase PhoX [Chitinophagaceae bacterium]